MSAPDSRAGRRLFFALPVGDAVRDRLVDLTSRLTKAARFTPAEIGWVAPENWHLTLHFLGTVAEQEVGRLVTGLPEAVAEVRAFTLDVQGIGCFPHDRAPRVLWAGVRRSPEGLTQVHRRVGDLVCRTGLTLQHDNFHAHVTLARFRSLKGTAAFLRLAADWRQKDFGVMPVDRVLLMESELRPEGAHYTAIAEGRLAS
jgi:2'-5' RNA ligase